MKVLFIVVVILILRPVICMAQVSGNIAYAQAGGKARAEQNERSKRALTREETPPTNTTMFVEASVLMNVKAEEYVAVFGVMQEGNNPTECLQKMDATIATFSGLLKPLGVGGNDLFVDFVAQNKTYGFELTGDVAKEKLVGFELKKNVIVHFKEYALLDKLVAAASQAQIFDLIKVDYLLKDTSAVQNRLMEKAARLVKQKAKRYESLLGIRLGLPAQIYAVKPALYFPTEMYDSYTAAESENINANYYRQKYIIQGARKSQTFFYNALDAKGFDYVINPVVLAPVVQATLYLKVKYAIKQPNKIEPTKRNKSKLPPGKR
jgi:uncharacterized protein YggE